MVHRQQAVAVATISFHACRLLRRVGVCVRRPHERVLPIIPDPVSRTVVPIADSAPGQLGVPLGRKYLVPHRVSLDQRLSRSIANSLLSFAQYTYGIYLGFNGESASRRLILNTAHSRNSTPLPHSLSAPPLAPPATIYGIYRLSSGLQCCKACPCSILQIVSGIWANLWVAVCVNESWRSRGSIQCDLSSWTIPTTELLYPEFENNKEGHQWRFQ